MRYIFVISFFGAGFRGWQYQPGSRTVQSAMTEACSAMLGTECTVTGCSRTDSGVHALRYYCLVENECVRDTVPPDRMVDVSKNFFPHDIALLECRRAPEGFHPRYSAKLKEYRYLISDRPVLDPFRYGMEYLPRRRFTDDEIDRMDRAGACLTGTHDFSAFQAAGSSVTDAVRTVYALSVKRENGCIALTVSADGFLYNMVRIIAGTLMEIGYGSIAAEDLPGILASRNRSKAGFTAPACGLYLNDVVY